MYICLAGYVELPIVLLYLLRCLVYHMLSKTRINSSLQSDSVYLLYLLRCLVYHMLFKTRRNSGSLHSDGWGIGARFAGGVFLIQRLY